MMNDQFDFDPATAAADFNTGKTGSSQQVATPKKPLTKEELESKKAEKFNELSNYAKIAIKAVGIEKLKANHIDYYCTWHYNEKTGNTSFRLYFRDMLNPDKEVETVENDKFNAEAFERYAMIGFIRKDGSYVCYTYESVLKSYAQKAIGRVLYDRAFEDKVDIELNFVEQAA